MLSVAYWLGKARRLLASSVGMGCEMAALWANQTEYLESHISVV